LLKKTNATQFGTKGGGPMAVQNQAQVKEAKDIVAEAFKGKPPKGFPAEAVEILASGQVVGAGVGLFDPKEEKQGAALVTVCDATAQHPAARDTRKAPSREHPS
jgi:hypothetical protein